ncbi:hypothetical protein PybrP1_008598 [[Pythium] brassicae (nom. inval.)]|nr:hypothetical protein PybrP1_008598 [[Pythium] brassicae (nom. inval.)]
MVKGSEFANTVFQAAAAKPSAGSCPSSTARNSLSGASSRYRVSLAAAAADSDASVSPVSSAPSSPSPKTRSASQTGPAQNAASLLKATSTNSRVLTGSSARLTTAAADIEPKSSAAGAAGMQASPKAAKLPHKLRQHVSRLRSQFALTSYRSLATKSPPMALGTSPSKPKFSSQSQKMQTLQAQLSSLRMSTRSVLQTTTGAAELTHARAKEADKAGMGSEFGSPARPEDPVQFFDLLRPLQNSLSCASLMSEWVGENDDDTGGGGVAKRSAEPHEPQQQPGPQPERDHSRMLRICCSVDNLLLSIGNQVQQEKRDEAIARGAARELVRLFQFALKQVATTPLALSGPLSSGAGVRDNNSSTASDVVDASPKELQYMQEFVLEIAERMGKLDYFVRATLLREIDGLCERLASSEQAVVGLTQVNAQLQTEVSDLRDFHANSAMSVLGYGAGSSAIGGSDRQLLAQQESNERRISRLFPVPEKPQHDEHASERDELQQLRGLCEELSRLLEMAKQEIQLCHHEREAQSAKIAELSSATFRDQELLALRNQLQSEKRRVKNLEIENVALRETEVDQTMKLHSLLLNSSVESASFSRDPYDGMIQAPFSVAPPAGVVSKPSIEFPQPSSPSHSITRQASGVAGASSSSPKRREHPSAPAVGSDESASSHARWFYAAIGLLNESPTRRKLQSAQEAPEAGGSFADQKQFLASLVMNDKQLAAAQVQSKTRRQGNVPTVSPPLPSSAPGAQAASKSRPRSAGAAQKKRPVSPEDGNTAQDHQDMVAVCSQLIWFFYQRFLMADEARALIPAVTSSGSAFESHSAAHELSLASVVLQFFLERTPTRDGDALRDAARFVRCLQCVRDTSADARFFCEFLDSSRSREELCFFLWTLQVVEDTKVGVPYETPVTTDPARAAAAAPHICVLKATFLTRIIYRVFHMSAAKRPSSAPPRVALPTVPVRATRPLSASGSSKKDTSSPSPRSSPRKKQKSRVGEPEALPLPSTPAQASGVGSASNQTQAVPLLDSALECFRSAVVLNGGAPLTLEAFNALLLHFAVAPSPEELRVRLGPFFHPTGDEKKLPLSVYLALILETFAHQLVWRKKTMRSLFVSLAQRQEAEEIAQQLRAKELAEAATTKSKRAGRGKAASASGSTQKSPKKKRKKKRESRSASDASTSKYLTGFSRALLAQFLVHAGIVDDVLHVDVDQLFVHILEMSHHSAKDVHFDDVYRALSKLNWLGNRELRVDPTTAVFTQQWQSAESGARVKMIMRLRDVWGVQARQSLALCENDLNSIRDFLAFAWRTAAKRAGEAQLDKAKEAADPGRRLAEASRAPQWFMTEFYFLELVLKRFCYFLAHLFTLHTSASFNGEGLSVLSWLKLASEFRRLDKQLPDTEKARILFFEEVDFVSKLSCPLVARVLLEHRAFLRIVFFYYAKQDADGESEERPECDDAITDAQATADAPIVFGVQLGKTKRNSMNFDEFQAFLTEFELLETDSQGDLPQGRQVRIESAQLVFRSVMSLENGDTTQMEFEEFSAAIAALAVFCDPSPFLLWYIKIDAFVRRLELFASRKQLRFD